MQVGSSKRPFQARAQLLVAQLTLGSLAHFAIGQVPPAGVSTTAPSMVSADQLITEIVNSQTRLNVILKGTAGYSDPDLRKSVAPEAITLIKKMCADSLVLSKMPKHKGDPTQQADAYLAKEAALGDIDAVSRIDALVGSQDAAESVRGLSCQIRARWLRAGSDLNAQTTVVDDLEKLDMANRDNISLAAMTVGFAMDAASAELAQRLRTLGTTTMSAQQTFAKNAWARINADDQLLKSNIGHSPVIEGETYTGQSFTSADWKGKVILVDFWATWCHYCVAQLPSLKQVYATYHEQGLEIVGVSNDHQLEPLQEFLIKQQVPWPQLYDPTSAENDENNAVAKKLHVIGIPQLFLIDRKGVVRAILRDPVDKSGRSVGPITPEALGAEIQKLLSE